MEILDYSHHVPREEGQAWSPMVSIFLTISLYFTVLFLDIFFFLRVIYHGSLLFLHLRCSKDLGGFKASDRHEQGHIIPIQMIALSFLVTLGRWKWFDMETRLTCSIFAMLSGGLTRTLGSCFSEGLGRFHVPSVALVSLLAPQTQQNSGSRTSKSQLTSITNITSSLKPSLICYHSPGLR